MKIAFLNIYSGINHRGAETFAHQLGNRLLKRHKLIFFQAGEKTREQRMHVVQIKTPFKQPQSYFPKSIVAKLRKFLFLDSANLNVLLFTLKLLPRVLKGRFDLVIPMNGFWQLILLKLLQPIAGYKLLVTGHSGPGWDERFNLYLKPNLFIATTQPAMSWAKKTCSWTRVECIPYAIDVQEFNKAKPIKLYFPKPIILCPAALVFYKRVDLAVKAVAKLKNASLVVLGKGELEPEIVRRGHRLLKGRFLLTSTPHDEIPSYYKTCDLVTLPSSPQENSPMVFLESLATKRLVVTTDTPRNRWMLEKAGIFCDPTNLESYTLALKKATSIKSEEKTAKDIDQALEKFRWETVLSEYEKIFESI